MLIAALLFLSYLFWQQYKTSIIDGQKNQMLVMVESLSGSMENTLSVYADDAEILSKEAYHPDGSINTDGFNEYLSTRDYVSNLILYGPDGELLWESEKESFAMIDVLSVMRQTGVLFEVATDNLGRKKFVFRQRAARGCHLEIVVDVQEYYQLISGITIGQHGYMVLKSSDGKILMHPDADQIGLYSVDDRIMQYKDYKKLDLSGLLEVQQLQSAGKTGTAEYMSYDWIHAGVHKEKKITAFDPVRAGDDFLVLSAVIDYDEVYLPMARGFTDIVGVIVAIFGVVICFFVYVLSLARKNKKNMEEILYLRDLNQVLEETQKSEEAMAHQQRLQIMGAMTGGIAHEFNNMLTPIMGYADMLMDSLPPTSEEYDNAKEIFEASEKARDIIRQISVLSRKNMETAFQFLEGKSFLKRSLKMIAAICPNNIRLQEDIRLGSEGFLGNATQMNQVLLNLCANAFNAIGDKREGTVKITEDLVKKDVLREDGVSNISGEWNYYIRICIADDGCGMSQETLSQIFTPFFTTKPIGKGTGLGLSIVDKIIDSHKGYITVKSRLQEGSVFTIYVPLAVTGEIRKRDVREKDQLKLLIIDENPKVLQMLYSDFQKLGIRIKASEDTEEARRILDTDDFTALLVDNSLSEIGYGNLGIDFAMSVSEKYPQLLRIVMTEKIQKEVVEAKKQGIIDGYMEKPVSATQIIEIIKQILKEKRG